MGFTQGSQQSYAQYASFADGKIVLRSKTERDGYTQRTTKVGTVVYEQKHNAYEGVLESIDIFENDYGIQWHFRFIDGGQTTIITDRINGSYAKGIISSLANPLYDIDSHVSLEPWRMDLDAGKYIVGCAVKQNGKTLPRVWCSPNTPEDKRNGAKPLPKMAEVTVSGKKVLDDTDQINVLKDEVAKIMQRIEAGNAAKLDDYLTKQAAAKTSPPVDPDAMFGTGPQNQSELFAEVRAKATSGPAPDDVPF